MTCPQCNFTCNQGRSCPARLANVNAYRARFGAEPLTALEPAMSEDLPALYRYFRSRCGYSRTRAVCRALWCWL